MAPDAQTRLLITSPLPQTWMRPGEARQAQMASVLLLGEWCRASADSGSPAWQAEVLPYHYDDRAFLARDVAYVRDLYEAWLPLVAERLNTLHGVRHDVRYWRIVIGPWLRGALTVLRDRFLSVQAAARRTDLAIAVVPDAPLHPTLSTVDFVASSSEDYFNAVLFRELLARSDWSGRLAEISVPAPAERPERSQTWAKRAYRALAPLYARLLPAVLTRTVAIPHKWPLKDLMVEQMRMGLAPLPRLPVVPVPDLPPRPDLRAALADLRPPADAFEAVAQDLVPRLMPMAFIEAYPALVDQVRRQFPKATRTILATVQLYADEAFKIWTAMRVADGARLLVMHYAEGADSLRIFGKNVL